MVTDKDDFIVALLASDPGIKYDYEQTQRATRGGDETGEIKLARAVLLDALETVRGKPSANTNIRPERCAESQKQSKRTRGRHAQEAREWFASNDERRIYGFVNICAHLNLDVQAVRKAIL